MSLNNLVDVFANTVSTDQLYVGGQQWLTPTNGTDGSIAASYEGVWSATASYPIDAVVQYQGSSYVALLANVGSPPALQSNPAWGLLAQVGAVGSQGPVGAVGSQGPVGAVGSQGPVGAVGSQGPVGPVGSQGPVGPVGSQGPAGSLIATFRGVWNPATAYSLGDVVIYSDVDGAIYSCYLAIAASTNQTPPSTGATSAFWEFIAVHGVQGVKGDQGDSGPRGPSGSDGSKGDKGDKGDAGADAPLINVESIILAVVSMVFNGTQFALINARITAIEVAQAAMAIDLLAADENLSTLNAKTIHQSAASITGNTSFGGQSLTKTNAGGLGSAVSLNSSSASTFSLGAAVTGGLSSDSITNAGAFSTPGIESYANGLGVNIAPTVSSVVHIGNPQENGIVYIHGLVYMPFRDSVNGFGMRFSNGFFSQI